MRNKTPFASRYLRGYAVYSGHLAHALRRAATEAPQPQRVMYAPKANKYAK
jgi:hypothetical protein